MLSMSSPAAIYALQPVSFDPRLHQLYVAIGFSESRCARCGDVIPARGDWQALYLRLASVSKLVSGLERAAISRNMPSAT
jgi:hypothetical protein